MSSFSRTARTLAALASLTWAGVAAAQTVEVAPGVQVTKKTYSAPINEQPFFGFSEMTAAQVAANEKFKATILQAFGGDRLKAFDDAATRAWRAIHAGNMSEAARRFNQAFLLAPDQSGLYHGYAVVVQMRFDDAEYAEELFKIARKQPNPLETLNADYGRILLIAKRPRDAQPVLEQAVIDAPDFDAAWSNLAFARILNGDRVAACAAADEAAKRNPSANVSHDLALIKSNAQCK